MTAGGVGEEPERYDVLVLVVDDDAALRMSVAEILRHAGHKVAEAHSGRVALELLACIEVAVPLLDMRMPDIDGIGVLDAVPDKPKVILMSGYAFDPRVDPAEFWCLQKPVQPRTLLDAVALAMTGTTGDFPGTSTRS